jgi:hypothetical protein
MKLAVERDIAGEARGAFKQRRIFDAPQSLADMAHRFIAAAAARTALTMF